MHLILNFASKFKIKTKSYFLFYSFYYAQTCSEFAEPIFVSLRLATQLLQRNVTVVTSHWQRFVRFEPHADFLLQSRTRYYSTNRPLLNSTLQIVAVLFSSYVQLFSAFARCPATLARLACWLSRRVERINSTISVLCTSET